MQLPLSVDFGVLNPRESSQPGGQSIGGGGRVDDEYKCAPARMVLADTGRTVAISEGPKRLDRADTQR